MNDFLTKENFKYNIQKKQEDFIFKLANREDIQISVNELSPGEQLLLLFYLWKFIYGKYELDGKTILLMDEPDAHIHPSAVHEFLTVLKSLVTSAGIQVILTTHNPTTVSMIDEENVFLMYEEENDDKTKSLKIKKGTNKIEIYNSLTSRLVSIDSPSRTLFVEGNDSNYYKCIYKSLKLQNNSSYVYNVLVNPAPNKNIRDKKNLQRLINFLKVSDECEENNAEKFDHIYALIDDDGDLQCDNRINMNNLIYLNRYSKENYVLDPINIFFYLQKMTPKHKIVEDIEKSFNIDLDFQKMNTEQLMLFYGKVLEKIKNSIIAKCFDPNETVNCSYKFNNYEIVVAYPMIFTIKNKKSKSLMIRNLFSIYNFDFTDSNKHNDPIKLYFTCKQFLEKITKNINEDLKNNFKETSLVICDLINNFSKNCDEIKNKCNFDLEKCTEHMGLHDLFDNKISFVERCMNSVTKSKKAYIEDQLDILKQISLKQFFEIALIVKKIRVKEQLDKFLKQIHDNVRDLKDIHIEDINKDKYTYPECFQENKIKEILESYLNQLFKMLKQVLFKETEQVYISNFRKLKYSKCFLQLRGHDLEEIIYKKIFNITNLTDKMIEHFKEEADKRNKIFIPFDLRMKLESLTKVYVQLDESNFEDRVFNTNMNWFVKFINIANVNHDNSMFVKG